MGNNLDEGGLNGLLNDYQITHRVISLETEIWPSIKRVTVPSGEVSSRSYLPRDQVMPAVRVALNTSVIVPVPGVSVMRLLAVDISSSTSVEAVLWRTCILAV